MLLTNDVHHDEINLFRLVRRLEKAVDVEGAWEVQAGLDAGANVTVQAGSDARSGATVQAGSDLKVQRVYDEIRLRAGKEMQKVKFARRLVRSVEEYERGSSEHTRRLNALKISLDKVEAFLTATASRYTLPPPQKPSLLAQLPPPRDALLESPSSPLLSAPPSTQPNAAQDVDNDDNDGQRTPTGPSSSFSASHGGEGHGEKTGGALPLPPALTLSENDNFLLSPPDTIPGLPSSGLVSALPALVSAEPLGADVPYPYGAASPTPSMGVFPSTTSASATRTTTTALEPQASLTNRKPPPPSSSSSNLRTEAHTSLQTELSAQLEAMAAQLKRNALHFADALEKDKAVVEAALGKVEGNLGFMEGQRRRLRDFAGKSGGTTWLTLGIVLVVLLVFVVMVGFIRMTRV